MHSPSDPTAPAPGAFDLPVEDLLLARLRRGDRTAQADVYARFSRPVFTLLRRMCGCPDTAADLLQDAFLHAFERIAQYRGEAPFGRWLRSVAATQALMHLRAGRRYGALFSSWDEYVSEAPALQADAWDGLDLDNALARLDDLPRAVLWLYHVEGYSHAEIGALCGGRTASFSKSQLSRAHQRLRGAFGAATPPPACAPAGDPQLRRLT